MTADCFADHRVLAHQNLGVATHAYADLLHLLGTDIVYTDDEALRVLLEQLDEMDEVLGFPRGFVFLAHLGETGIVDNNGLKTNAN